MSAVRVARRTFILAGAAAVAATTATVLVIDRVLDDNGTPDERGAQAPISELDAIRKVGEAYREAVPDEDAPEVLIGFFPAFDGLTANQVIAELPSLQSQVQQDFDNDRTVVVDFWLLSVTEGRAAALVSTL